MRHNLLVVAVAAGLGLAAVSAPSHAAPQDAATSAQLQELQSQIAALQARLDALQERTDAQSDINVANAKAAEDAQAVQDNVSKLAKLVNDTKLSGRMYYNLSNIDDTSNGVKTDKSGFAFDIKRFYLGVDHKFDDKWAINLTTDFQYSSAIGSTEIYLKKAYVQYTVSDAFVLRAGSTDLPWVPFAESSYGMRYVENTLIDRLKFGTSADWGIHASGKMGGAMEYAVAAVNGNGYKNPSRSKGLDVEGRLSFTPTANTVIGIGAYSGTLGKEKQTVDAEHTANRMDFMAAYASGNTRFGVEYFQAKDWNNVLTLASDKASGWSTWGSVGLGEGGATLFARYDQADPSKTLDPTLQDTYYNVGIEYPFAKGVKLAMVYKHNDRQNDSHSVDLETNEFGVWGEFRF